MKSIAALTIGFVLASAPAFADGVHGIWSRDGHPEKLEFYDCGGDLCAKGTRPMPDGSPAPVILRNAPKIGANQWKGDLFNPEDGKTYQGTITLESPTKLTLKGCLIAFLCKSESWTKVQSAKAPTAAAKPGATPAKASPAPAKPGKPKPAEKPAEPAPEETK